MPIFLESKIVAPFKTALQKVQPDIVVVDFATLYGIKAANELGVPVVIFTALAMIAGDAFQRQFFLSGELTRI